MRWTLAALSLAACFTGDADRGFADVCLVADGAVDAGLETSSYTFEGTLIGPTDTEPVWTSEVHPCQDQPHTWVGVITDDGLSAWAGYAFETEDGAPIVPEFSWTEEVKTGSLLFRSVRSFGDAAGFVLSEGDAPTIAVENGSWGPALEAGDVGGLEVTSGPVQATQSTDCGPLEIRSLAFDGDDTVELTPIDHAEISVGGRPAQVHAIANGEYGETNCLDIAGQQIWGMFPTL